jgi:hypothetical protein
VRALTRIATPANEAGLAEIAGPLTGNQLERFARAHRHASAAGDADAQIRRRLAWRLQEDGSLAGTFRLPPRQGAVLLKALRAAAGKPGAPRDDLHGDVGVSAETSAAAREPVVATSSSLADGLVEIAGAFLAGKVAGADDPEVYQVIVHAGTDTLAAAPSSPAAVPAGAATDPARVSAETPTPAPALPVPAPRVPGHPADPARCHFEDGPALSVSTAQMIACGAAVSWMRHDDAGQVLALGRAAGARTPRCAARPGSGTRAGAGSRAVSPAGWTCTTSCTGSTAAAPTWRTLISLYPWHHKLIHDRGYLIVGPRHEDGDGHIRQGKESAR